MPTVTFYEFNVDTLARGMPWAGIRHMPGDTVGYLTPDEIRLLQREVEH